ncbi:hypothetical protein IFR05_016688 [Cadophora sp. M221]|nr:hypothetical protein IFR05_016688 [Cadophora sp. M221]
MYESEDDTFYDCLTPPQTPSPQPSKKFYLPLSTLSIYCRENGSSKSSNKRSILPQDGSLSNFSDSATINKDLSPPNLPYLSSVVESSSYSHMTDPEAAPAEAPRTPPSTPPTSRARLSNTYQNAGVSRGSFLDSSPTTETPPLSPSASVSTTESVSEPPTPTRNGSTDPTRFSTPRYSTALPPTSDLNKLDNLTSADSNARHIDSTLSSTPATPTPKPARKKDTYKSLASNKKTTVIVRKRKVSKFIPEPGPFIPEGLHLVEYPAAQNIIEPDTLEAGHIIGYGLYPVQTTALKIARERCRIMRNKMRHYTRNDVKNVSSGSVSGESETLEEMKVDGEKGKELNDGRSEMRKRIL